MCVLGLSKTAAVAPEALAPSLTSPPIAAEPATGDSVPAHSDASNHPPAPSTAPEVADKDDKLQAPGSPVMVSI